ncbi:histidine phosphatase family protein [Alteribacillus bidgolensis]|uniref:Histidine phosphatase superfamily (Branch 1) n=1 Tax=Alteribacillus bidgolensis TaxID=930129 RepID=A0A1G8D839_9BACI|nr:histidine phosphatase family protein [Alteribacillus bidgolensis]SDH53875.1 hypothetical protein SAMN05216352_101588 [Alteribacillus bidgolensis]
MNIRLRSVDPALYHFAQSERFKLFKTASANILNVKHLNSVLSYVYEGLPNRYGAAPPHNAADGYTAEPLFINRSLLDLLQEGGYIFYTRHGEATVGEDQPNFLFENCFTQRNLSEAGRRQAVLYGEVIRTLRIPIEYPIITAPFCRTRETAELAFGKSNLVEDPFWINIYRLGSHMSAIKQERILNSLHSFLEIPPAPRKNKVVVAHSFPPGVGLGQIPNMGTVVVKPFGQGNGYEIAGYLTLGQWMSWME